MAAAQEVTPWYNPDVFEQQALSDADRARVPLGIAQFVAQTPVRGITLREVDGSTRAIEFTEDALANEAWPVIEGVSVALDERQRGSEWDFVVRVGDERTLVSVRWNAGDRWDVELGRPFEVFPETAPTAPQLRQRFAVGEFEAREAQWDTISRDRLARALGKLSPEELAVLEGLPMVRGAKSELGERGARHAAEYVMEEDGSARLWLLDRAFLDPGGDWAGPIDKPEPDAVFSLVHEVGHAIVFHPVRQGRIDSAAAVDAYNQAVPAVQAKIDAYNALVDRVNGTSSPRERNALVAQANAAHIELQKATKEADELGARADQLVKRQDQLEKTSPVMAAWLGLVGERLGPTPYSTSSEHEGFADAFALYKVDPDALQRAMPAAYAWFVAGKHIEAMREGPPPG